MSVNKIPVFIFKQDSSQVGRGSYKMIACFVNLGIHVPYVATFHGGEGYLTEVNTPFACDGICEQTWGTMEDWSKERSDREYPVKPIVETALVFYSQK
ncbi:hypothetical protein HOD96_01675 [Candidatus Falkowbacteria bacterium]|jgi:hypothetical protein|nr:hypothetical protein [Candidatus Falkowbacteria bacterium]MBT4433328.1 hypothetical protein [Candidatus Falkowbacteria bacterium]